ncbi:beta-ketoacyl synthase chain length factor [Lysobacter niastensis]|uniref:Beta-ketoacyl synthase chain length factor n=1 Tax=Lysobacter niastensis TaxID=380629 RepID=A0ABS0B8M3_9GAMM|nr:beta-ketoacyl synthase chain length factor [Lysobacter niastensis]MBF6023369.1 beta-ketoacyl synthase chain length factor [Lysobacter niastensis]
MIEFTVADWAAWAPGLQQREDWQAWALQPTLPRGDDTPALSEVPAMQRRRIERLGRMAVQVACWCAPASQSGEVPLVFASRHGDVQRSFELLDNLTRGEPMSPTHFGLSVHNAIAALYTIIRGERGNYTALAAGRSTAEAAMVEAAGLLADGAPEVLVVVYDAQPPEVYANFLDEPDPFYAWSWRVRAAGHGDGARISLASAPADGDREATVLPHGLDVMRFLLSGDAELQHCADGVGWTWRRHA